jgi:hypothetical protein
MTVSSRLLVVTAIVLALAAARFTPVAARGAAGPADLDALMAPVALYPDQLLAQMLLCSGKPSMVGTLSEWLRSQTLKGSELQDAAIKSGFEPSFAALTLFPQVVDWMAGRPDWTAKVGAAFTADKSAVFDSVQRLRAKARAAGTLKSSPQQQVETKTTSSGQQVIVIEPANPQIVYVPQYNPQTVYTQPTTVVVEKHDDDSGAAIAAGVIGFTAGIAIGAAFDNDYYYGPYGWHGGAYMYNDAWDDYYDNREDAREDWQDHREDMYDERSDRAKDTQEQRTERQQNTQQQRTDRQQTTQEQRTERQSTRTTGATTTQESRGYSDGAKADRSGTKSDAFSGYSSGKSERAASQRGQKSRSSSRSSGSRRR